MKSNSTTKQYRGKVGAFLTISLSVILLSIYPIIHIIYGFYWGLFALSIMYIPNIFAFWQITNFPRSSKHSKWSWGTLLILMPLGGFFIYLKAGYIPLNTKLKNKNSELLEKGIYQKVEVDSEIESIFEDNFLQYNKAVTSNNKIDLIKQGFNKTESLISDIEKAETFINIKYFIINDGIMWRKIENSLIKKIKEGVKVRILIDYVGSVATEDYKYERIMRAGAELVQFNKVFFSKLTGEANYRMHKKLIVIDNKVAYIGGLNIGDEYSHLSPKYGYWEDLHFRVEGEVVDQLNKQFIVQWFMETDVIINNKAEIHKVDNKLDCQVISDGPQFKKTAFVDNLIKMIKESKTSLKLVSPYLVLPSNITSELIEAVRRGVKVDIFIPGKADKKSAFWAGKYYAEDLSSYGVNVYRTENIFLHSKVYIKDDNVAIIGSTNLDFRALFLHHEFNLVVNSNEFVSDLIEYTEDIKKISYKCKKSSNNWNLIKKFNYQIIKLASPML